MSEEKQATQGATIYCIDTSKVHINPIGESSVLALSQKPLHDEGGIRVLDTKLDEERKGTSRVPKRCLLPPLSGIRGGKVGKEDIDEVRIESSRRSSYKSSPPLWKLVKRIHCKRAIVGLPRDFSKFHRVCLNCVYSHSCTRHNEYHGAGMITVSGVKGKFIFFLLWKLSRYFWRKFFIEFGDGCV